MPGITLDLDRGQNELEGATTGGFVATAPSVQVAPAMTPHRFEVVGPDRVRVRDGGERKSGRPGTDHQHVGHVHHLW